MKIVDISKAETQLFKLLSAVEAGEEVILERARRPVARIVPLAGPVSERKFGAMKGRAATTDAFFKPLPDDEQAAWNLR